MTDREGLSFGPFDRLPLEELRCEERYWWGIAQGATAGVQAIAERHRQRCMETIRARQAFGCTNAD